MKLEHKKAYYQALTLAKWARAFLFLVSLAAPVDLYQHTDIFQAARQYLPLLTSSLTPIFLWFIYAVYAVAIYASFYLAKSFNRPIQFIALFAFLGNIVSLYLAKTNTLAVGLFCLFGFAFFIYAFWRVAACGTSPIPIVEIKKQDDKS